MTSQGSVLGAWGWGGKGVSQEGSPEACELQWSTAPQIFDLDPSVNLGFTLEFIIQNSIVFFFSDLIYLF